MEHFNGTGAWLIGGGLLAGCWNYIKTFCWRIASMFIVRARLEAFAGDALLLYCWRNMKRSPFGERRYSTIQGFVRPVARYLTVGYEKLSTDSTVFWSGWIPLSLAYQESKHDVTSASTAVTVTFIRGMFNLDKVLIDALEVYNREAHGNQNRDSDDAAYYMDGRTDFKYGTRRYTVERQFGYGSRKGRNGGGEFASPSGTKSKNIDHVCPEWRLLKWLRDEVGEEQEEEPLAGFAFPKEVEEVIERCKRWKASESWYKNKRIPWRLGLLFHGLPGTGKTSLTQAIAQELDLPVVAFDLASYGNEDFVQAWRNLMSRVPCMALLEDIDAIFEGRENRLGEEGGGLSFDCLLNCLSGIEAADGVITVVTTNNVDALDPALGVPDENGISTRPGRIDIAVLLGPLDEECRYRVAKRILADCPEEIADNVMAGEGETGAQFSERCAKVALIHYWQGSNQRNGKVAVKA